MIGYEDLTDKQKEILEMITEDCKKSVGRMLNRNEREYKYSEEKQRTLHEYTDSDKFKEYITKAKKDHPTL